MGIRDFFRPRRRTASVNAGAAGEAGAANPDEAAFTAKMIADLKSRDATIQVTLQPDPLSVTVEREGNEEWTVNFHRVFDYCTNSSPSDCAILREAFLNSIMHGTDKVTPTGLRLAVRARDYLESAQAEVGDDPAKQFVAEAIGEDLMAVLVSDSSHSVTWVNMGQLADLRLGRADAWRRAWVQTRENLPELPVPGRLEEGAVIYEGEDYLASLLIDTDGWQQLADTVGPNLFITVVADGLVVVGSMPDGDGLDRFKEDAREDCAAQARCVSPYVYRFQQRSWTIAT